VHGLYEQLASPDVITCLKCHNALRRQIMGQLLGSMLACVAVRVQGNHALQTRLLLGGIFQHCRQPQQPNLVVRSLVHGLYEQLASPDVITCLKCHNALRRQIMGHCQRSFLFTTFFNSASSTPFVTERVTLCEH
jgi:hypothetical protein